MDPAEIARLIEELENRVERLRAAYDQYFMGIERLEPLVLRKEVDRRLWMLRREQIRNTRLRFKLETTIQRYNTYQQYWQRIVREIENGTYQRDLGRAALRFGENAVTAFGRRRQKMFEKGLAKRAERDAQRIRSSAPPPPGDEREELDEQPPPSAEGFDVTFDDAEPVSTGATAAPPTADLVAMPFLPPRPAAPPTRPALVPPPRPRVATDNELSAVRLRQLYAQYVEAKRRANESTVAITFDKVAANLRETAKKLESEHRGRKIDFEVVLQDGKPVLKPVLKG